MANALDVRRIIAEVARKHGALLEEDDPLFVALEAHAVVLEELAARLISDVEGASKHLKAVIPNQMDAAMRAALETAAQSVRRGIDTDIQGASLKARAIVDSVYRSRSGPVVLIWIAVGLVAGVLLFGAGVIVGRSGWILH